MNAEPRNLPLALVLLTLLVQICAFQFVHLRHISGLGGVIGDDYAYFLPSLLNGYYWMLNNGVGAIPWFTPAVCGGLPFLPNPQNLFYSVPQVFTLLVDPLTAVAMTFLLFAIVGFVGLYLLCRRSFGMGVAASLFGATIFMFNGFYTSHMLVGHLTLHSYMLIPLTAVLVLQPIRSGHSGFPRTGTGRAAAAGVLLGYVLFAGGINFIIPVVLALIGIWALHRSAVRCPVAFWGPCLTALLVAGGLAALRLHGAVSFVQNFPRDHYQLPGFEDFGASLWFTLRSLFLQPSLEETGLLGAQFRLEDHEGYFSLTPAALIVLGIAMIGHAVVRLRRGRSVSFRPKVRPEPCILVAILLLPIALNTHEPGWTEFLGTVPYISSHSHLLRWIAIDIPILVLLAAVTVETLPFPRTRAALALFGVVATPVFVGVADFSLMDRQQYRPGELTAAYMQAKRSGHVPEVRFIEAQVDGTGRLARMVDTNQRFIHGASAYPCYEPIFGYRLEQFPLGALHAGPVFGSTEGVLNFKDPVCYVYGHANACRPGDHFAGSDVARARALAGYRPVPFARPIGLQIALFVSTLTAMIVSVSLIRMLGRNPRNRAGTRDSSDQSES